MTRRSGRTWHPPAWTNASRTRRPGFCRSADFTLRLEDGADFTETSTRTTQGSVLAHLTAHQPPAHLMGGISAASTHRDATALCISGITAYH